MVLRGIIRQAQDNQSCEAVTWEDMITINHFVNDEFEALSPVGEQVTNERLQQVKQRLQTIEDAINADAYALPSTKDREGYHGEKHFDYWLSGYETLLFLEDAAKQYGVELGGVYDFGCASGRVLRHFAVQRPETKIFGSDINKRHIDWVNKYLPSNIIAFCNTSIPTLPMKDEAVDLVTAFSVFTHIEAFDMTWLMELHRILRPGGLAWVTIHSDQTWLDFNENWPLYKGLCNHPTFPGLDKRQPMSNDKLIFRWHHNRSYTSNVFYHTEYIHNVWGRLFEVREIRRRYPIYQDAVILQKRA